ncbi:MAG: hypothetical protein CO093_08475 [Alphaproteobacteria bacterium CG_4_9_14_3_um_filter_47_13]|nr:MAG: hypothetical protein CO093_08475 [Alphaproteobacteria bacterium CG_4_9_14_3_um_filter_47_13]
MNDITLIKRAVKGDKRAFEALLQENYDVMFKMAFKYCGNRQDAEDITQDSCIKLARALASYKFQAAFTSWLYRLVLNCAKDFYRKKKPEAVLNDSHIGAINAEAEIKTYANEILAQVYALPENEKSALILVMSDGYTHAEAAIIMDCKESTVSWYIHEARKKLNILIEKEPHHG